VHTTRFWNKEAVIRRRINNGMAKKGAKRQATIYKTLHRKSNIE
jgi:hypothetical protein